MRINLDNYFDKVLVINTNARGDRYRDMSNKFIEMGMVKDHFEFADKYRFEALLGGHTNRNDWNVTFDKGLNNGELGCYLSHLEIYRLILQNKWQKTLILEDDAVFTQPFFEYFDTHYKSLPKDWDMWYLGRWNYDNPSLPKMECKMIGIGKSITDHLYTSKRNWLTHAYAVNYKCAQYLYDNAKKDLFSTIDGVLSELQESLNVYSSIHKLEYSLTNGLDQGLIIQDPNSRSSLR